MKLTKILTSGFRMVKLDLDSEIVINLLKEHDIDEEQFGFLDKDSEDLRADSIIDSIKNNQFIPVREILFIMSYCLDENDYPKWCEAEFSVRG